MNNKPSSTQLIFASSSTTIYTINFEGPFDLMADCQIIDSLFSHKVIVIGSGYQLVLELLHAVNETLESHREVDNDLVGKIAQKYMQSNFRFINTIQTEDVDVPPEDRFAVCLGNDIISFMYSVNQSYFVETSDCYPNFYNDHFNVDDYESWISSINPSICLEVTRETLLEWRKKLYSFLPVK